ncbi:hypothetical protein B0T10DRAFT_511261 [Thelonectria olida]|uniref:Thiomorpholine-carboxylate dehydrogenase n=1 Tax=Thelonectria olida TaxID=1576542 RepID=A0A9P8W931_9HYPO|nr:hypothetical protein B0T10DRAFT_511261 [Thelonectria olida]
MAPFLVLSDSTVHEILIHLSKDEIISFQKTLEACLMEFSTGDERQYQLPPGIVTRPNGQKTLFRPFTSPTSVGTKIAVEPAPDLQLPLHGMLALCDEKGLPTGVINAEEVTGYRTSLTAMIPYLRRRSTQNIVVFGAGKQALWHIRLALALRGPEIHTITIVNRSEGRAQSLLTKVEEENKQYWKSEAEFTVLSSLQPGYNGHLAEILREADIIFCTVGSSKFLFPLAHLLQGRERKSLPFVSAIGSWQADMIELDPDMLKYAANLGKTNDINAIAGSGGMVIVDDLAEALVKSGEIIQSGLGPEELIEVGQVLEWNRDPSQIVHTSRERFDLCLEEGFLIFKVVGVSATDLAAGNAILSLARDRSLGVVIQDF